MIVIFATVMTMSVAEKTVVQPLSRGSGYSNVYTSRQCDTDIELFTDSVDLFSCLHEIFYTLEDLRTP